ncbi:GGDEF domain-containing protein [Paucibacter soli]|uniref:GGDEF domain-containing protein n=1 Tax=Paucibacter soli TaxID=3133433 RepID=UPI00309C5325
MAGRITPFLAMPFNEIDTPRWLPMLGLWVQRLGLLRTWLLLCAGALMLSLGLAQLGLTLLGQADNLAAALVASGMALACTGLSAYLLLRLVQHVERAQDGVLRHATEDPLTGTLNRRHFLDLVEREWSRARRYDMACALLLMDVDHFKRVNERFGHRCGDQVLREIAAASVETLRHADVLARFGGEEFIVFLPHTDPLGALDVAERMRERVEALQLAWNGAELRVSVSLGVAALHPEHLTLDQLIHDADAALAAAKSAGRNCVRAGAGLLPGKPSMMNNNN